MPKTVRGAGGGKRHPLNMRTTRETREKLEAAALANGRSLAQEVEVRLERSFSEERALGGPEMRELVALVISSFSFAARMRAPDDPDWRRNREAFRAGMFAVVEGLLAGLPGATHEEIALEFEAMKGRLLTRFLRNEQKEHAA